MIQNLCLTFKLCLHNLNMQSNKKLDSVRPYCLTFFKFPFIPTQKKQVHIFRPLPYIIVPRLHFHRDLPGVNHSLRQRQCKDRCGHLDYQAINIWVNIPTNLESCINAHCQFSRDFYIQLFITDSKQVYDTYQGLYSRITDPQTLNKMQ